MNWKPLCLPLQSREARPALKRAAELRLTIDLSQGYRIEHVDERGLLFHLGLPVPPLQVPEEPSVNVSRRVSVLLLSLLIF